MDGLYPPNDVVATSIAAAVLAAAKEDESSESEAGWNPALRRRRRSFPFGKKPSTAPREYGHDAAPEAELQPPAGFDTAIKVDVAQVCDGPVWALDCSQTGLVATGGVDHRVVVRRLDGSGEPTRLVGHTAAVYDVAWCDDDDDVLISASADSTARLWRVQERECAMVFQHGGAVCTVAVLGGDRFATGGLDRTLRVWSRSRAKAVGWAHVNDSITAVAARARRDGETQVAVGLRGGQIFLYKQKAGEERLEFDEMLLSTMRSGAFLEAERCGASGVNVHDDEDEDDLCDVLRTAQSAAAASASSARREQAGDASASSSRTAARHIRKGLRKASKSVGKLATTMASTAVGLLLHPASSKSRLRTLSLGDVFRDDEVKQDDAGPTQPAQRKSIVVTADLDSVKFRVNSLVFVPERPAARIEPTAAAAFLDSLFEPDADGFHDCADAAAADADAAADAADTNAADAADAADTADLDDATDAAVEADVADAADAADTADAADAADAAVAADAADVARDEASELLASANGAAALSVYDATKAAKSPAGELRGGLRTCLKCAAAASECGTLAVAGSEDGRIFVWRLGGGREAQPAAIDAGARNALVRAVTVAKFAPARAARNMLGGEPAAGDATAFIVAVDYSGRLVVFQRGAPTPRSQPASGGRGAPRARPGSASVTGSASVITS
ncbi:WD40-repeat-containing domain protein [Pelagophyceae sp. CCMP2097]|nr:WD40-repeat-containing domain protein [Pelagophyceae sp. CCMP2097]